MSARPDEDRAARFRIEAGSTVAAMLGTLDTEMVDALEAFADVTRRMVELLAVRGVPAPLRGPMLLSRVYAVLIEDFAADAAPPIVDRPDNPTTR